MELAVPQKGCCNIAIALFDLAELLRNDFCPRRRPEYGNICLRSIRMYLVRIILWPLAMSYTGFILTGQGLRTFNSLSITEAILGALTGFLLAVMFTLREKRRQRPAFVAHSVAEILPCWGVLHPKRKPDNR